MKTAVIVKQKPNIEVLKKALDIALDNLRNRLESEMGDNEPKK